MNAEISGEKLKQKQAICIVSKDLLHDIYYFQREREPVMD